MPEGQPPSRSLGLGLAWVIAAREFTTRIRAKTFLITTVLAVGGIAVYILLQAYVFNGKPSSLDVGYTSDAQPISAAVSAEAAAFGLTITTHAVASTAAGHAQVSAGTLDALVSGPPASTIVTVNSSVNATLQSVLIDVDRETILNDLLTKQGVNPTPIDQQLVATSVKVNVLSPLSSEQIEEIVIGLLIAGTLYITLVVYGQLVAAGVVEEKSNRIVEILLTTVRPWQLMLGKITGIGLVALVQIAAMAVVGIVLASFTKLVSIPTVGVDVVVGGVIWFVLGYVMYALVYAGAASMVSRQEDVAGVAMPVTLLCVAGWILALTVAAPYPAGNATAVLSMIPPLAPMIMPVRIAAGTAPLWQVLLSIALSVATIYLLAVFAGRIYRNSVLRMGGRVKWGDALGNS